MAPHNRSGKTNHRAHWQQSHQCRQRLVLPARHYHRLTPGKGTQPCVFDHTSLKPEKLGADVAAYFNSLDVAAGDVLVAFGWALAEDLEKYL